MSGNRSRRSQTKAAIEKIAAVQGDFPRRPGGFEPLTFSDLREQVDDVVRGMSGRDSLSEQFAVHPELFEVAACLLRLQSNIAAAHHGLPEDPRNWLSVNVESLSTADLEWIAGASASIGDALCDLRTAWKFGAVDSLDDALGWRRPKNFHRAATLKAAKFEFAIFLAIKKRIALGATNEQAIRAVHESAEFPDTFSLSAMDKIFYRWNVKIRPPHLPAVKRPQKSKQTSAVKRRG